MGAACPVALIRVDEYQVRMHAFLVMLAAVGFVWSGSGWLLALLLYDFGIRVLFSPKGSPFYQASRGIVALLPLAAKPVDAGPKRFAAKIGLVFVIGGMVCFVSGYAGGSCWLMGLMALFAALEAACGFCVGCRIYTLLLPLFKQRK